MNCSCSMHFDQQLLDHIKYAQKAGAEALLSEDVAKASDCSGTLLHYAAYVDNDVIIPPLVALGCPVDSRRQDGKTPLMIAVERDHGVVVKVLLEAGADISAVDANGHNALHKALHLEVDYELVEALFLQAKTETPAMEELVERLLAQGLTLSYAVLLRDATVLENLLRRGLDVNARNFEGRTALHLAVLIEEFKLAELLIDRGADVNALDALTLSTHIRRTCPLYYAVWQSNPDMVQLLLDRGADPKPPVSFYVEDPLYRSLANTTGDEERLGECAELLLQGGAFPPDPRQFVSVMTRWHLEILRSSRLNCLVAHQAMIDALGVDVYDQTKHLAAFAEFGEYYEKCRQVLKSAVAGQTSLIDLLGGYKLRVRARNPEFVSQVEKFCSEPTLKELYPYYARVLRKRVSVAERTVELEKKAIFIVCDLFQTDCNLLNVFARQVVSYLSERDLEQLVACEVERTSQC